MSSSKKDRTTAPRMGSRPSKAKHVDDRNVAPPAGYRAAGKPKPGEHAMRDQLARRLPRVNANLCQNLDCGHAHEAHDLDDSCSECECRVWTPVVPSDVTEGGSELPSSPAASPGAAGILVLADLDAPPPADPWWTPERERAFSLTLQGAPQHVVAGELGRDRHTVARWVEDDRFVQRLFDENASRFKASRQRRAVQTVRLTDKAESLAVKMLDKAIKLAEKGEDQLGVRLAARDWLQEFRENSRREDEIYGIAGSKVDVNVHGNVQHQHRGKVDVSFKAFLTTSLENVGVDLGKEEVAADRADAALVAVTERALLEGTFLDELVEREKEQRLAPMLADR